MSDHHNCSEFSRTQSLSNDELIDSQLLGFLFEVGLWILVRRSELVGGRPIIGVLGWGRRFDIFESFLIGGFLQFGSVALELDLFLDFFFESSFFGVFDDDVWWFFALLDISRRIESSSWYFFKLFEVFQDVVVTTGFSWSVVVSGLLVFLVIFPFLFLFSPLFFSLFFGLISFFL